MLTVEQLEQDVAFLAARCSNAGRCSFGSDGGRDYGVSSNAIVRLAYGGTAPTKGELPADRWDLMACQRAFDRLPPHRKTEAVRAALDNAWAAITAKVKA